MTAHLPPVPPAARSPKDGSKKPEAEHEATHRKHDSNTHEQGEHANIEQNTTNKGHAGDR